MGDYHLPCAMLAALFTPLHPTLINPPHFTDGKTEERLLDLLVVKCLLNSEIGSQVFLTPKPRH